LGGATIGWRAPKAGWPKVGWREGCVARVRGWREGRVARRLCAPGGLGAPKGWVPRRVGCPRLGRVAEVFAESVAGPDFGLRRVSFAVTAMVSQRV
jgi:hypothetical protein